VTLAELRAVIAGLPEPALVLSGTDHRMLAVNRAFLRLCGRSRSPLGERLDGLLAPDEGSAHAYLRRCAGSIDPLPGALGFASAGETIACRCDGMRIGAIDATETLAIDSAPPPFGSAPVVLIHCRPTIETTQRLSLNSRDGDPGHENLRRRAAEEAWAQLNASLEQQVAERTRELVTANERLLAEIAERRQAEAALRQAQKMEVVGQLTGGVAHDFNNLLTVISGNLELLEQRGLDPKLLRIVGSAKRAAARGEQLTQQLLAFSRKQFLRPQSTDVNKLIGGMSELLRSSLGSANTLVPDLAPDLWHCQTDPNQLEIVLLNLAINARDAMANGGTLTIATTNATMPASPNQAGEDNASQADYVRIAVTDTGTGIPSDILDRVFEPFFTTKEAGRGSGLGLSQVYGFVNQSNGLIRIDSALDRGTTVMLHFPRAVAAALPYQGGETGGRETQISVLTVEDDPDIRELAVTMLADLGYRVTAAPDGVAALRIIEQDPSIDLLFTDIVMPGGIDGFALARQALQTRPDMKVLFTSGYSASALTGNRPAGGRLIGKPYRPADLAREIAAILQG
jgi:signal transduction histidine kinase